MTRKEREDLDALRRDTQPTPAEVEAVLLGSLEAEEDEPQPTRALLRELGTPTRDELEALQRAVISRLDAPPSRLPWVVGAAALAMAAVAAWWLLT